MYTERKYVDEGGRFEVPGGYEIAFEPRGGYAAFPLTVIPEGDISRSIQVFSTRPLRFGPWGWLRVLGQAGDEWAVTIAETTDERIGDGGLKQAIRLFKRIIAPGESYATDTYTLNTWTSGASASTDLIHVVQFRNVLLRVTHGAINGGAGTPTVTAMFDVLGGGDSETVGISTVTYEQVLDNSAIPPAGLVRFQFGPDVTDETAAGSVRRGDVVTHLSVRLKLENTVADPVEFADGLWAELWGVPW